MTWAEFVDAVDSHLAVEANRRGLDAFRARYMRNAVLDLQRYIRGFRTANTTVYTADDLTTESQAQLGALPTGAKPKAFYIYSVDEMLNNPLCYRYRLGFYPWNSRQDLICGRLNFSTAWLGFWCTAAASCPATTLTADQQQLWLTKAYVYTLSPMGRNFLIYPQVTASTRLLLVWDGYKYTYADSDTVNFPEEAAEAVGAYVMAKIMRNVDKNIPLAREFDADYARLRLALFRDFQETQDAEEKDEEYNATNLTAPLPAELAAFGAQTIPFLSVVTTLAGSGGTALAAIPTTSLDAPFTVQILRSGVLEVWVLTSSSVATIDGVSQRPNDFDSSTNAKVWLINST